MAQKILIYSERDIEKMVKDRVEEELKGIRKEITEFRIRLVDLEGMIKIQNEIQEKP